MSSEGETVRVNFGKPMPVFPLTGVVLLPHAVLPLHIFEPRYTQMIEDALDGAGQIAMAVFQGQRWRQEYHGRPPIRPIVCVAQIVQHEKLVDGRYNVLVQGVCRARMVEERPADERRLYREAMLTPLESAGDDDGELEAARDRLESLLSEPPLTSLAAAENIRECLGQSEAPTAAVLELVGVSLINDEETRYRLLEEADPGDRAALIIDQLEGLRTLLDRAERQIDLEAPKGVNWN